MVCSFIDIKGELQKMFICGHVFVMHWHELPPRYEFIIVQEVFYIV